MKTFKPNLRILPKEQKEIWTKLSSVPEEFVLYGGTAIALQLGHRTSVDFDFFSSQSFVADSLIAKLAFLKKAKIIEQSNNTLTLITEAENPVKLSFFGGLNRGVIKEPLVASDTKVKVASLIDLAGFKLKVILQRAEAKDYLDVAALLNEKISLASMLSAAEALFSEQFPKMEAAKALSFHEDGDLSSLPEKTKSLLRNAVESLPRKIPKTSLLKGQIGAQNL